MTESLVICVVCNEAVEPHTKTVCNSCGLVYHLNQRSDIEGKDCGEVWVNEDHLGLEFACNICLQGPEEEASASLDDILDIAEAALLAGMSEANLEARAAAGRVRHRRTSSGVLLFERRTIIDLSQAGEQGAGQG